MMDTIGSTEVITVKGTTDIPTIGEDETLVLDEVKVNCATMGGLVERKNVEVHWTKDGGWCIILMARSSTWMW